VRVPAAENIAVQLGEFLIDRSCVRDMPSARRSEGRLLVNRELIKRWRCPANTEA